MAPQTPRQRRANERYARQEASKKGKPESAYKKQIKEKSPINTGWIILFAFLIAGGGILEILHLFSVLFCAFSSIQSFFKRLLVMIRPRPTTAGCLNQHVSRCFVRNIQTFDALDSDVHITRAGKTVVSSGSGGRSSRSGFTATVFGAPGLIGSQLVAKLAKHGTITVVPYRDEPYKRHLKVSGDLGVVNFVEFDLQNVKSIEDSVKYSDIVYNLIGRDWETKNFSFDDVHVEGAKRIAEAVAKHNVSRFIHVSSHSADVNSSSKFLRSKALGEIIVRDIIPDATIVRPGPVFASRDYFIKGLASSKFLLTANNGKQTVHPTYLSDVATALETIGYDDSTAGKLYELNGPYKYSISQILDLVRLASKRDITEINLPKKLFQAGAGFLEKIVYWRTKSPDEIEREFIDQIVTPGALGYRDLGIKPQSLGEEILHIAREYKIQGHYDDPLEAAAEKQKVLDYINATEK